MAGWKGRHDEDKAERIGRPTKEEVGGADINAGDLGVMVKHRGCRRKAARVFIEKQVAVTESPNRRGSQERVGGRGRVVDGGDEAQGQPTNGKTCTGNSKIRRLRGRHVRA